jgi:signal transduction histidine kinase
MKPSSAKTSPRSGAHSASWRIAVWHLGCALVAASACGALIGLASSISPMLEISLGVLVALGLLGFLWRPRATGGRRLLVSVWGIVCVGAVGACGGLAGPLMALLILPLAAGMALGVAFEGLLLSLVGLGVALLVPGPDAAIAALADTLSPLSLAAALLAAAGAFAVAALNARAREAELSAQTRQLETILGDLPTMAMALAPDGRTEAVFGRPLHALSLDRLHHGFLEAAAEEADRQRLEDARAEALALGEASVAFRPSEAPYQSLIADLRRTEAGGVAVVFREAPEPVRAPTPVLRPNLAATTPAVALANPEHRPAPKPESGVKLLSLTARLMESQAALKETREARRRLETELDTLRAQAAAKTAAPTPIPAVNEPAPFFERITNLETALAAAVEARRKAEARARDAESLAMARSRFLANMSHELRTPLNAIMGFSDIMRARMFGALPAKYGDYAELIHESGRHLMDLINDVLDMSKIEAERFQLNLETFDARDPVNAALRLMRLQADDVGVQLRGRLPAHAVTVEADRRAVKQIVLNLVSNALKFTPKGGLVAVSADGAAGALEIVVADTGVGIADEDLVRLGKPFEQAGDAGSQALGSGLGLSLVKAFAQLHGGDMSIESRLGEGTAVTVRLPVLKPPADAAADKPPAEVIPFTPAH